MLTYYSGSELQDLAEHLLKEFENKPVENPLAPEVFIVQNHGMAQWLSLYIAEGKSIAANLKFEFPAERIWSLIRIMDLDVPDTLPSDRSPMRWSILNLLKTTSDPSLDRLWQYVEEKDPLKKEMRRWKLAGRIADVFDQYLTYRPEMLLAWEQNKLVTAFSEEQWQSVLWRMLVSHWDSRTETAHKHRATLQQDLLGALEDKTIDISKLPQRISVFGVSTMPPVYLRILVKLSELTDVYFYNLEPKQETSNPIHESLGNTGKEYRNLLQSFIGEYSIETDFNDLKKKKDVESLLQHFQQYLNGYDINYNTAPGDASIQIHSCHSTRREVEVLYHQLLAMFEEDETLNPSDVLVVTPNLEVYSPEIKAIFETTEEPLPEIPFHLAENNAGRTNPVAQAVIKLLELADSRFKVTDVLDLLDSTVIQEKFSLSEENLKTLERWIDDNRIRWGIDKESKAALNLPETESFTWKSGIDRMMLGYAMKPQNDRLFENIYPYKEVERSEDALLAGRFSSLMSQLFNFHKEIQETKTVSEWAVQLREWLFRFIPEQAEFFRSSQKLRLLLEKLENMKELSGFNQNVPFRVIRDYLKDELEDKKSGGGRSGKGVTFSSMVPVRNIPARVICILGMNDSEFPGSKMPVAFDLINKSPKPGDRSHSDEDRQLFLETILAARERLYFSYTGQSNRQDTEYPPSVVLRELQDCLSDIFNSDKDKLVTKHPLQSFSPRYFRKNESNRLINYSSKNRSIADRLVTSGVEDSKFLSSVLPEPDEDYYKVTVSELLQFFQHPAKYLLQKRLGLYLNHERILDEDREPFQLKGLEGYKLGQELLNRYMDNKSPESFQQLAKAISMLPDGLPGEQAYYQKLSDVEHFTATLQEVINQKKLEPIEIDLEINSFRITGKLHDIYKNAQVLYRFGNMRSKEHIEFWLKHLLFQGALPPGHSGASRLYAYSKREGIKSVYLNAIEGFRPLLSDLLQIYKYGLRSNTFFFPDTSFAYAENIYLSGKDIDSALKKAGTKWQDDYASYPKEGDDPYNKLIMRGTNPLKDSRFKEISERFWKSYFENFKQGEA